MKRTLGIAILAILAVQGLSADPRAAGPRISFGAGLRNSYTFATVMFDGSVGERSTVGAALQGYMTFSDRVHDDTRYSPVALAVEPYWLRYGTSDEDRTLLPYFGLGLPVGTVFIPNPPRSWNNIIGGLRLIGGVDYPLPRNGTLFLDVSLGMIMHFVFGGDAEDPYSTRIDGFSGFGISTGYRF